MAKKIFISYRRDDSGYTSGRIYDFFADRFGKENILKDIDDIRLGSDFRKEIERMAEECELVAVVMGPRWNDV